MLNMANGPGFKAIDNFSSQPTKKLVTSRRAEKFLRVLEKYGPVGMPAAQAKRDIAQFAAEQLLWSRVSKSEIPFSTLMETEKYIASNLQICTSSETSKITVEQNTVTIPQKAVSRISKLLPPISAMAALAADAAVFIFKADAVAEAMGWSEAGPLVGVLEAVAIVVTSASVGWLVGEGLAKVWNALKNAVKTTKDSFSFAPALDEAIKNIL